MFIKQFLNWYEYLLEKLCKIFLER
jgi:hypothetical protein